MRPRSLLAAAAAAFCACAAAAPPAGATIAWTPCTAAPFQCGRLAVPLDPAGGTPGTLTLSVKRAVAATNPTASAVIGLAGGPGQAAIPFAARLAEHIAPALATRDLVVFDQRGTGESGRLRCPALETPSATLGAAPNACANEIGPSRAFYRTNETVEDIEAVRREGGYEKLVLYATSYGTKVATAYAARYPARVEALLLDSVVLPEGPDVFDRSSFQRVGPALRALCGASRCRGITGDPRGDLAALVRRVEDQPLRGTITTTSGDTTLATIDALDLVDIVLAGDFDPTLRADLPAAVRSALHADAGPILRLAVRANAAEGDDNTISDALFATTVCEEAPFPWRRGDSRQERVDAALRAVRAIPRAQLGPFDTAVALLSDVVPLCVGWPNASPAPVAPGPLPPVPTLILDGQEDIRTPVTDAAALAARIPGAQLVEVPFVGHSVIGSDPTGCARAAVAAFFAGQRAQPCAAAAPQFPPTTSAPTRLDQLPGAGRAGKTLTAVVRTLADDGQVFLGFIAANRHGPKVGTHVGGLRSGRATWTATGISLRRLEYVPGVVVSGFVPRAPSATTKLTVTGDAAHGTVSVLAGGQIVARLDGRRVTSSVPAAVARRFAAVAAAAARAARAAGFRAAPRVVGHP